MSDDREVKIGDLRGRDAVREMGRKITSQSIARVLRPLIATSMGLFGSTPASVLARVETFSSLMVRNAEFSWKPASETAGTMALQHGVELPDAAYAIWEGVFLYVFELTDVASGRIGQTRLIDGGREGVVDVWW